MSHLQNGNKKRQYKDIKDANIDAELTADLVGDYLFTDSDFVNHLSAKHRNVFQKIYDEIKYLFKAATKGSKEARELERVKRAFDKAYKESGNETSDTKYSLDKYTEKQYNDFGWARDTEAISKNELDDLYSKVQEKGSLKRFTQSSTGEAIIEVNDKANTTLSPNNVILFVTGTEDAPEISRVVRINLFDEDSIDIIRKDIYENTDHRAVEAYARRMGEEILRYYDRSNNANYREYTDKSRAQQSGGKSERNPRANRSWTWRDGTFTETQSNEIAPINEASSADGVFFDGENSKYSLSSDVEAPIKHGNFNISENDVRLDAPIQDGIAENATTTPTVSKMEQVAEDYQTVME